MNETYTSGVWPPAPMNGHYHSEVSDPVLNATGFKRRSTILLVFLAIFTLGISQLIWLYKTASIVKQKGCQGAAEPVVFVALWISIFVTSRVPGVLDRTHDLFLILFMGLLMIGSQIALVVYMFKLRNSLNMLFGNDPNQKYWMGFAGTFFFNIFYMNYKINRAIEAANVIG